MASTITYRLISGSNDLYFNGPSTATPYSGSGTPWTSQSTSPFRLAMNDVQGRWTPQVAAAQLTVGGGTRFRGAPRILYKSYPLVTETVPLILRANSTDNAVALKRLLAQYLNSGLTSAVCQLAMYTSTNIADTVFAEIYSADVQEEETSTNEELYSAELRVRVTWTRSPLFTCGGSDGFNPGLETSINGTTYNNTGTGSPDNVDAFAASPSGDLITEGQPCKVIFRPSGSKSFRTFYLATVYSRTYSTTGAAALSTSSTTGTQTALNTPGIADAFIRDGLRARSLMRFTNNTSNVQIRVEVRGNASGTTIYAGPWITPTSGSATLYDMGRIPLDAFKRVMNSSTIQLYIGYRSTNGASATTTLGYNEFLLYYDFCQVDTPIAVVGTGSANTLALYTTYGNVRAQLPMPTPIAAVVDFSSSEALYDIATLRGAFPRMIDGASFYAAWMEASNVHATTDAATVSFYHMPLYYSFRGDD